MTPLELVDLGFAVCEVAPPRADGTCTCRLGIECRSPGKHPIGKDWLRTALRQRDNPRAVAMRLRMPSYGLVPVPGSGMLVIDRDDPEVGLPMPETFEVHRASADPRKGHYYFRLADEIEESDVPRTFAGGEIRVAGSGHVVGPGSRHVSGDLYEGNDAPAVGIADRELIDALRALPSVKRGPEGAVEAVEGSRHDWLVRQARKFAGWGWDVDRIFAELEELDVTVCVPPLNDPAELSRMAQWAADNVKADAAPSVRRSTRRTSRGGNRS